VRERGTVSGYNGPCLAPAIHFDYDGQTALSDLRAFVDRTCKRDVLEVYIDDFKFWFSGNKGFHAVIENDSTRTMAPATDTPEKVKRIALKLAGDLGSFDRSIYDRTRIFRIPNSRHGKSGFYKIPLLAGELFTLTLDEIKALAQRQRSIQSACQQWLEKRKAA
jgi:hypothetical protein